MQVLQLEWLLDNIDTAIAISKEAGILPHNYEHTNDTLSVMEGKTFR